MLTIEKLEEFGAETKDGLERCLNDAEFYLDLIPGALERGNYERIEAAIHAGNLPEAFEAAHALKGILGNLALMPIYEPVSEMTECLRARDASADYPAFLKKMWAERDRLEELINK
ncbi:MAG: Hpt domain-containing protein [Lachnospiraceae bacterium]|nr:Hpt domain-containing protein [Lachnospiraceae bacterium]